MIRSRALFYLIVGALAILCTAGTTTAAFACSMPLVAKGAPIDPDCGHRSADHDCALACAPLCAAVGPVPLVVDTTQATVKAAFWNRVVSANSLRVGPEPPPPRPI